MFNEDIIMKFEGVGGFEKKREVRYSMSRLAGFVIG